MNPFVLFCFFTIICDVLISARVIVFKTPNASGSRNNTALENRRKLKSWSEAAFKWIVQSNCTDDGIICGRPCQIAKELGKSNYRVYATEPISEEKYTAVFFENDIRHKSTHDNILVLDPFPAARFGHPVIAFYVDTLANSSHCNLTTGLLADNATCMQPVYRIPHSKSSNFRSRFLTSKIFCQQMLFLPLVFLQRDSQAQSNDKLECRADIEGFHRSCPKLRSKEQTDSVDCHRIKTNRDCGFLENSLRGRCSSSQTCDHAVLLSGGWSRQYSDVDSFKNMFQLKDMLMKHGFRDNNIAMFLANGEPKPNKNTKEDDHDPEERAPVITTPSPPAAYRSATMKSSIRNHIHTLCEAKHCADTLLIYLNSPAMIDGTSLLWDLYDNGVYDDSEAYTPKELMRDIGHCQASRVIVLADQSYGEELVAAAESRSINLSNVIVVVSTENFDTGATKDRLTHYLLENELHDICLNNLRNNFSKRFNLPVYVGSQEGLLNSTLVGSPCFEHSTLLTDPNTSQFRGCRLSSPTP